MIRIISKTHVRESTVKEKNSHAVGTLKNGEPILLTVALEDC